MNYTGILSPNGSFTECESYEHLALAKKIAEKLSGEYSHENGLTCEEYLQKLGYITVRARDVYGLIGYPNGDGKVIRLSDEQRKWFEDNYDGFPTDKQRSVDDLIGRDR